MKEIPSIGDEIRRLRKGKKFTTRDLGERLGISHVSISKYESGQVRPSEEIINKIAQVLSTDVEYLKFLALDIPEKYKKAILESGEAPSSISSRLSPVQESSQMAFLMARLFKSIGTNSESDVTFYAELIERLEESTLERLRVTSEFERDLNRGVVSVGLRKEFENNGILVSQDATISVEEKNSEWTIIDFDKGQAFLIRKRGDHFYKSDLSFSRWTEYYKGRLEFTKQRNEVGTEILEKLYDRLKPYLHTNFIDLELFVTVALKLGREHYNRGNLGKSRKYYLDCQSVYEMQNNQLGLSNVFKALAGTYEKEGDYTQTVHYLSLTVNTLKYLPLAHRAQHLHQIGLFYRYTGELEKSEKYQLKSLNIWQSVQDMWKLSLAQAALSALYHYWFKPKEALVWAREAKRTLKEVGEHEISPEDYFNTRGLIECATAAAHLVGGNYRRAIELSEDIKHRYEDLSRIYKATASNIVFTASRRLVRAYWKTGKLEKGEQLCLEILKRTTSYNPHNVIHRGRLLYTLGEIYLSDNRLDNLDNISSEFQKLNFSEDNPQYYPTFARFSLLEARIALTKKDWQSSTTKFSEAIRWAKEWNPVLLTYEIEPEIREQINSLRESSSSQADELVNTLNFDG